MRPLRRQPIVSSETTGPAPDPVVAWRVKCLREAGFSAHLADELARRNAYDLHALLELVDRGCPPGVAVRILAPIDGSASC
jgi:hypothetical protein